MTPLCNTVLLWTPDWVLCQSISVAVCDEGWYYSNKLLHFKAMTAILHILLR